MRALITGAAGSGTTTLGSALAREWGAAFFDADDYFWLPGDPPYSERRSSSERLSLLSSALKANEHSVIAGAVMGWGEQIEEAFDFVVFLYVDTEIRLQRLQQRELERFGRVNPAFLEWASQYDAGPAEGRSLAKHNAWLASRRCRVIRLVGRYTVAEHLSQIAAQLPNPP